MRAPMTLPDSDKIAAVQHSFLKLAPHGDALAADFYNLLFETYPDVRRLFPKNMESLRQKFIATLSYVITGLSDVDEIVENVQDLGRLHKRFQATPQLYEAVGGVLLATLEKRLGVRWTPELAEAWTEAYVFLAEVMLDAAENESAVA